MQCGSCGADNPADSKFCMTCGNVLAPPAPTAAQEPEPPTTETAMPPPPPPAGESDPGAGSDESSEPTFAPSAWDAPSPIGGSSGESGDLGSAHRDGPPPTLVESDEE